MRVATAYACGFGFMAWGVALAIVFASAWRGGVS